MRFLKICIKKWIILIKEKKITNPDAKDKGDYIMSTFDVCKCSLSLYIYIFGILGQMIAVIFNAFNKIESKNVFNWLRTTRNAST